MFNVRMPGFRVEVPDEPPYQGGIRTAAESPTALQSSDLNLRHSMFPLPWPTGQAPEGIEPVENPIKCSGPTPIAACGSKFAATGSFVIPNIRRFASVCHAM